MRRRLSTWLPLLTAVVAVLVRLPFLTKAESLLNSDEAIEGLMARHIFEWPILYWGQGYRGVPEVYLVAPVFAMVGAGVVQMKIVTIAIWAAAVACTTRLGQRWSGDLAGGVAGLCLAFGAPPLVSWTVSGNAEVAWLTLIFAGVLLAYERSATQPASPISPFVPFGCAAAIFVQPIAASFVAGLAVTAGLRSRWWHTHGWRGFVDLLAGRPHRGAIRLVILIGHALLACFVAAFLWTYLGGDVQLGVVTARHPQKVFREVAAVTAILVVVHALSGVVVARGRALRAFGWFAIGLAPVALHMLRGGAVGSLISVYRITDLPGLAGIFLADSLPMVIGTRDLNSVPIVPWWTPVALCVLIGVQLVATSREWLGRTAGAPEARSVVAVYTLLALLLMLFAGGIFSDVTSYRYVLPFFGLAALAAGAGARRIASRSRVVAGLLVATSLAGFAVADIRWFRSVGVDDSDHVIARCLEDRGIRAATADYWIAYRMTFLAGERVIVNPSQMVRYQPYADLVRQAPKRAWIQYTDRPVERVDGEVICRAATLEAVVVDPVR